MDPLAQWLDGQTDRRLVRQQFEVEAAKLLATFLAAVAAGLVATAFQVRGSDQGWPEVTGLAFLALTILISGVVVLTGRIAIADEGSILTAADSAGLSEEEKLKKLKYIASVAVNENERMISKYRQLLFGVVACGGISCTLAGLSLLGVSHG